LRSGRRATSTAAMNSSRSTCSTQYGAGSVDTPFSMRVPPCRSGGPRRSDSPQRPSGRVQ
jgi:hypothetical protein